MDIIRILQLIKKKNLNKLKIFLKNLLNDFSIIQYD
jgi:hypothetical protein